MLEIEIPNLTILIAIGASIAILTLIQLFLALRHDHAVSVAGPLAEIDALFARIEDLKASKVDHEAKIDNFKKALVEQLEKQAEADALRLRIDELQTEWISLQDKRIDVQSVREEAEKFLQKRQQAEADLSVVRAELDEIRYKLEGKEKLDAQLEALKQEKEEIGLELSNLRREVRDLSSLKDKEQELKEGVSELEAKFSRMEGETLHKEDRLGDLDNALMAKNEALAKTENQLNLTMAQSEAQTIELNTVQKEKEYIQDKVRVLETKSSQLNSDAILKEERLAALGAMLETKGASVASLEDQIIAKSTQSEAHTIELNTIKNEKDRINAELVVLKLAIEDAEKLLPNGTQGSNEDPLKELSHIPPAIITLRGWSERSHIPENEALKKVQNRFETLGLRYHKRVLSGYHTAMKINQTTQMAVLAGISGTGKSQLPRQYALGMGIGFLQVPVQPRWDSPQDLMGFYNYIEKKFRPTDMARALWAMDEQNNPENAVKDRMLLILLDEMNLARVEYYFSDFLSRLESRPLKDNVDDFSLRKDAQLELEIPNSEDGIRRIFPGYNLLFAGTMNEDESTQTLSDKVVDRANILRFAAPDKMLTDNPTVKAPLIEALSRATWETWMRPISHVHNNPQVNQKIERMVVFMKSFGKPFGHRLGLAMMSYVANYPSIEGDDSSNWAIADQVEMRLLPKLRGIDTEPNVANFVELGNFVRDDLNDPMLAEAIQASVASSELNGQFEWSGVAR